MNWENQLTRTPYLVLFILLAAVGMGTASALVTITLAGDVDVIGNLNVIGEITGQTITNLQNQINSMGLSTETQTQIDNIEGNITSPTFGLEEIKTEVKNMETVQIPDIQSRLGNIESALNVSCEVTTEVCDYVDNDCDALIDEDFIDNDSNYITDMACGNCFTDCNAIYDNTNSTGYCETSGQSPLCSYSCDPGTFDINGDPSDGCEFVPDPNVLHVSETTGADDGTCGDVSSPCATIAHGLVRAGNDGVTNVHVANGNYQESITVVSGINLKGAYDPSTWNRNLVASSTIIEGTSSSPHTKNIIANTITSPTLVEGFLILGKNNPTPGGNSYGIWIKDSTDALTISNNKIIAGAGGDGSSGTTGSAGTNGNNGSSGGNGYDTNSNSCSNANDISGGAGGILSCGTSVNGGSGGNSDGCPVFDTKTSTNGLNGGGDTPGSGGLAGFDSENRLNSEALCSVPSPEQRFGDDGSNGANGGNGLGGAGCALPDGDVSADEWVGNTGTLGVSGTNGSGGGGGGAGGGAEPGFNSDDYDIGGSGGGGASGGCGGNSGSVGSFGGGSFGIFVVFSTAPTTVPSMTNNEVTTANGGNGGNGGHGNVGGVGGQGGIGGIIQSQAFCSARGGSGGYGGAGGAGGGAGGSCGGVSYGIFVSGQGGASLNWDIQNTINPSGSGGLGGSGGFSLGNSGQSGQTGSSGSTSIP